jgi:hypothetical protein
MGHAHDRGDAPVGVVDAEALANLDSIQGVERESHMAIIGWGPVGIEPQLTNSLRNRPVDRIAA